MGVLRPQDPLIDRIASGRTDLVFDFVSAGQPATFVDAGGASLISWCSYYDVSAIRFLVSQGERLASSVRTLALIRQHFTGTGSFASFFSKVVLRLTTPTRTPVKPRYTLRSARRIGRGATWR
jgi:hypothetical protein